MQYDKGPILRVGSVIRIVDSTLKGRIPQYDTLAENSYNDRGTRPDTRLDTRLD
jgi:hypothetical protein